MAFPGREQGRSRRDRNFGSSNIYKLATLVVMLGVTFSRGLFSTSIDSYVHPKEAKAKWATTNKKRELGYIISMFGSIDYLCGAIMLAWTLRDRDPNHDLVAVISGKLDSPENYTFAVEVLEEAGYKVYNTPLLEGPTKERPWFKYYYSKLNVFGIDDYEKLVLMDVDYFLLHGEPKKLVSKHSGHPKPAAFSNNCRQAECLPSCKGPDCENVRDYSINSGFFIFKPSKDILLDMKTHFNTIKSYDEGDQGFIDEYYKRKHQGFDYLDDQEFQHNWLKSGPVPTNWKALHIFGVKPWHCPRGLHCACSVKTRENAVWPEANDLWWQHYDDMVEAWPWTVQDAKYKNLCMSTNDDCNWGPGAKLRVKRFKPKGNSLAFVHIPKTGGGSIEKAAGLKGIRWGVCNYWSIKGICPDNNPPSVHYENPFLHQWFHVPLQWIPDKVPTFYEGHDLFAIIRNPYDRMVSEFFWQCHKMDMCKEADESKLNSAAFMNEWLQTELTKFKRCPKVEKLDPDHPHVACIMMWSGHFIHQSDYVFNGSMKRPMVDYVLHAETLEEEFSSLMREYNMDMSLPKQKLHDGTKSLSTKDLDWETIELINEVYRRDFNWFKYKMM